MVNQVKSLVQQALQAPDGISTNDPHTDIVELDSIITYVEDLRLKLLSKRAAFRSAINEIDSPIIRFLPPEILSRVFTLCSIDFVLFEAEEDEQHCVTPLFFGSVCRRWREVAWSTPELWTYIPVHLTSQNFDITRVIQICSQWLDRSGELPLNIRISFDAKANYSVSEIQEGVDSLIATLLHYSRRWRYLDIRTPFSLRLVHDECPLEYLCIDLRSNASRYTLPPSSMNCQCLPNLRKLYLSSVSLDHLHIQWDNITHIKLASPFHIFDCQNIFQRCPKLVYCSFSSVITKGGSAILGTIRLPSLKFLELGHSDHEWYSTDSLVPSNFELPALEELRYRYLNSPSETRSLSSLLKCSSSRLQSLVLDSTRVTWDDLGPLLKLLLDLKKLSFKTGFFYYALFTELSRTAEGFLFQLDASRSPEHSKRYSATIEGYRTDNVQPRRTGCTICLADRSLIRPPEI